MPPVTMREDALKPGVLRRLRELKKLYRRDKTYAALVDMYRYLDAGTPEIVAYWYAHRDWEEHGGPEGHLDVLSAGYTKRELGFLSGRGLTRPRTDKRTDV